MTRREDEVLGIVGQVDRAELTTWIAHGWVLPAREGDACYYSEIDIARVRLIAEMRHDLRLDEEAIDVVLPLLDQVYDLRCQLRAVLDALGQESETVRRRIKDRLRPPRA